MTLENSGDLTMCITGLPVLSYFIGIRKEVSYVSEKRQKLIIKS